MTWTTRALFLWRVRNCSLTHCQVGCFATAFKSCASSHIRKPIVSHDFVDRTTNSRVLFIRDFHSSAANSAGHNKWSNIRHGKALKDNARAVLFQRLCVNLRNSVQRGGGSLDPIANNELQKAIEACKAANMPKETLQRQLDKIKNKKFELVEFDIVGPSSTFFIIQAQTDNRKRTLSELTKMVRKIGGGFELASSGVRTYFDEKGIIEVGSPSERSEAETDNQSSRTLQDLEEAETVAIEVEAEDVKEIVDEAGNTIFEFHCDPLLTSQVETRLKNRNLVVINSEKQFIPLTTVSLTEKEAELITKFYEKLDSHEEIEKVFDNVSAPA